MTADLTYLVWAVALTIVHVLLASSGAMTQIALPVLAGNRETPVEGRGCMLHKLALVKGLDYHDLKPMVSALFPLTFGEGTLTVADEVSDGTLVCLGAFAAVYRGGRGELLYYFGPDLVAELDALEALEATRRPALR